MSQGLVQNIRQWVTISVTYSVLVLGSSSALPLSVPQAQAADTTHFSVTFPDLRGQDFLTATNSARQAAGLPLLQLDAELTKAAQAKADDMITNHYWDHFRPSDKKAPWDFIREAGYQYHYAGENLARGFKTAQGITNAWLASPAHRANLLSSKYTDVGFAVVQMPDGDGQSVLVTVQLFGAR